MKRFFLGLSFAVCLYAEDLIDQEIKNTSTIDDLTTKMNNAPKQYRHRYIQAIKERSADENQAKRALAMQALQEHHVNTLTGKNESSNSTSGNGTSSGGGSSGSGNGNGNGNGGHGGGRGGGK